MSKVYFALAPDAHVAHTMRRRILDLTDLHAEDVHVIENEDGLDATAFQIDESDGRRGLFRGMALGALAGLLVGIAVPLITGSGSVLVYALFGVVMGPVFGGLGGALTGSGRPDRAIEKWRGELRRGRAIVSTVVRDESKAGSVKRILRQHAQERSDKPVL